MYHKLCVLSINTTFKAWLACRILGIELTVQVSEKNLNGYKDRPTEQLLKCHSSLQVSGIDGSFILHNEM